MIQVCSACGTRWNVRDKRRTWCPRCQGALQAPIEPTVRTSPAAAAAAPAGRGAQHRPNGYRWIAVRPGPPPIRRDRRRHSGPTPHYDHIPRWSLPDPVGSSDDAAAAAHTGLPPATVHRVLQAAQVTLAIAAAVYLFRYMLQLINRTTLLHPVIAIGDLILGVAASLAALVAVIATWWTLTRWLIERRAAAYAARGGTDPRSTRTLRLRCLIPPINLFWAPVFAIETAKLEERYARLRKPIQLWWLLWVLSAVLAVYATIWTLSFDWYFFGVHVRMSDSAQALGDNTVETLLAYLAAGAAVWALDRLYRAWDRTDSAGSSSVGTRWVPVAAETRAAEENVKPDAELSGMVESAVPEPAA